METPQDSDPVMAQRPKVTVIILNYNGSRVTMSCLEALSQQSFQNFEVLILDNGSTDDSRQKIQTWLSQKSSTFTAHLIPCEENLGFAGGNAKGLRFARGETIALLNNDTEPDKHWLREIYQAMERHPQVGICASKLIHRRTGVIDSAGDGFSSFLKGFKIGEGEECSHYNKEAYVFGACAGAALYRKKMIEEVGFLDEDFFLIDEDTDLNFRAHLYGWQVLFVPTAIVYHRVRFTIGAMSQTAVYYSLRNAEFVRIKNIPWNVFVRFFPYWIAWVMLEFFYFVVKHKNLKLYCQAKFDVLRNLRKMVRKRKLLMQKRRVKNDRLSKIITPAWEMNFLHRKIKKFINHQ